MALPSSASKDRFINEAGGIQLPLRVIKGLSYGNTKPRRDDLAGAGGGGGQVDVLENVAADQLIYVEEGKGIVKRISFPRK